MAKIAVIPVAGLGTRWLPLTRSVPKELLPVYDRSAVAHVVDELLTSGIEEIVFVTSPGKPMVAEHFRADLELLNLLETSGKAGRLSPLVEAWNSVRIATATQTHPRGLGHAIGCARDLVGDRPFVVALPDEIMVSDPPAISSLKADAQQANVLFMTVPRADAPRYGMAKTKSAVDDKGLPPLDASGGFAVDDLVEKPSVEDAPSSLAIIGRYLLPSRIFEILESTDPGHGGEIQLTDALAVLAREGSLRGTLFGGRRFDVGNPRGALLGSVYVATNKDPSLRAALLALLEGA